MLGWLLNLVYVLLIAAVSPVLVWRAIRHGKYREGWREKLLGRLPRTSHGQRVIWLHAVSVGEVLQLRTIVPQLQRARPDWEVLITTTTSTGHAVARETFADCRVSYFPLDFTWAVRTALARVQPQLIVLVELELWPNFVRIAHSAKVPIALINGRISRNSHNGYRRIRGLMQPLLGRFSVMGVQTDEYAARLLDLGALPDRITVTGSVKFDGVNTDCDNVRIRRLRQEFGIRPEEQVFIAGSTHDPEERIALDAYLKLRQQFNNLRLILVPRHAERFDEVAAVVEAQNVELVRRSEVHRTNRTGADGRLHHRVPVRPLEPERATDSPSPVCLLDTLGELTDCWGLADVAFVGGSLTRRGGQNMIEPAAYGANVIVGPNTHNFRDVVEGLAARDAISIVHNPDELRETVRGLLQDPVRAKQQGAAARDFVLAQQGATDRTLELLTALLPAHPGAKAA